MFVCALSEQERRGCLAPGQGGQSWGVGGPQGVGVPPPPPRGAAPQPPVAEGLPWAKRRSAASRGGREGGRRGAGPAVCCRGAGEERVLQKIWAADAGFALPSPRAGRERLGLDGPGVASGPASTPALGSCPSWAPLPPLPGKLF